MWFNEDEDFEDGEAVVPAANTGGATTDNINPNTPPGGHNHLTSSPTKSTKLDAEFDTAIGKIIDTNKVKTESTNGPKNISTGNNNNNNNNGGQGTPSLLLSGINTMSTEKEIDAQSVDDVATTTVTSSVQVTPSSTIASTPGAGECPPLSPPTSLSITTSSSSSSSSVVSSVDAGTAVVTVSSPTSVNAINTSTAATIGKTSSLFKKV